MLRGFFDDSQRNPQERQFILAGWTATVEEWIRFSSAWQSCLDEKPRIGYFKSYEANNLCGEFFKFSPAARDEKRLILARSIASCNVRGYIATASHNITKNKPKRLGKMMGTRPYDWAFMTIVSCVLQERLARGDAFGKIDFIFDRASELRACIESYEEIRGKLPLLMRQIAGDVFPGDDRELVPLQAADLFAGEVSYNLKTQKTRDAYQALISSGIPIVHSPAIPPVLSIEKVWGYAQKVYQRRELVSEILRLLKEKGIKLEDLK